MANGSRGSRGDEYIFIDGKALRADEVVRVEVDMKSVKAPGQKASQASDEHVSHKDAKKGRKAALRALSDDEAFALRGDGHIADVSFAHSEALLKDDRRKMRRKYLFFGLLLAAVVCFSLCVSNSYHYTLYSPDKVVACLVSWFRLLFVSMTDPNSYAGAYYSVLHQLPMYEDVLSQVVAIARYLACGLLLALSGMLYQNVFRNPIAAPSMLGVSNGINAAILILVLQFGMQAQSMMGYYYLYSYIGGAAVLLLVIFGGRLISGTHRFNVMNMLLIGAIVSQLLSVILTYVQNVYLTEDIWVVFYRLQIAVGLENMWTYVTLAVGLVISLVPIFIFRFRLNLVSFSDEETRLLGVDPTRLRILALACGSIMILTAQINAGQVAMVSLVVPFIVRQVFGAEFRKQLVGNILIGASLLVICGDVLSYVTIGLVPLDLGTIVTICALPLFVWMMTVQQRSWE